MGSTALVIGTGAKNKRNCFIAERFVINVDYSHCFHSLFPCAVISLREKFHDKFKVQHYQKRDQLV